VTERATSRRHKCRPDRAQRHGELADLAQIHGVWTLRDLICDVGGEESWEELLDRIDTARRTVPGKKRVGSHVGIDACIDGLTVLASLHRSQEIGFRGLIGSSKEIAKRCGEILGRHRGCSERTMREAFRVLEHADLLGRWTHGRGRQVERGDDPETHTRRHVLALTLSVVAISYWSAPRRRKGGIRCDNVPNPPSSANCTDNTILRNREPSALCNARPSYTSAASHSELLNAESPVPGDVVEHGAFAPTLRTETAGSVPHRFVPWRPQPSDPNDLGHATRAILYDLETTLLHHRRPDRSRILGLAGAELDPRRKFGELAGITAPPNSGLPWDDWIWRWRGMPLADRRIACERALLPGLLGGLKRIDLCRLEPDPSARPPTAHPREIGPRLVPQRNTAPPETRVDGGRPPPRRTAPRASPRWAPEPEPEWLINAKSRYGGEEN
jgi:hypothetical protein